MSKASSSRMSRRQALTSLASALACETTSKFAIAGLPGSSRLGENCDRPIFSTTGPNAELYGAADGYPIPDVSLARRQGNPWEPKYRVGAFSHLDALYPTRQIRRAVKPWMFKCSTVEVRYPNICTIEYGSLSALRPMPGGSWTPKDSSLPT